MMFPPRCFTVLIEYLGSWAVFLGRLTCGFLSDPNKLIFVSSDHNTIFQFGLNKCTFAKFSRLLIFFLLSYGTFRAIWPFKPASISLFLIVRVLTGAFKSFLRSSDDKKDVFFDFRIRRLSNFSDVARFLPRVSDSFS